MPAKPQTQTMKKRLLISVLVGVLLASVTWLFVKKITESIEDRRRVETKQLEHRLYSYAEVSQNKVSEQTLEQAKNLLNSSMASDQKCVILGALHTVTLKHPENVPVILPILLQYTRASDAQIRFIAVEFTGGCGRGNAGAVQRLQELSRSDPDEKVRKMATKALAGM